MVYLTLRFVISDRILLKNQWNGEDLGKEVKWYLPLKQESDGDGTRDRSIAKQYSLQSQGTLIVLYKSKIVSLT
jgi:hypothetical protein